jgi:thioredoxin reductase (NADPH)
MLVRGPKVEFTMSQYLVDQLATKCNVTIETNTVVVEAHGEGHLEALTTQAKGEEPKTRDADALFVMIGANANTSWLPRVLERDERGYICTGRDVVDLPGWDSRRRQPFMLETNLPGFFCAGDVRHESIKRVSSGVGEGSMAIAFIHQYLALDAQTPRLA